MPAANGNPGDIANHNGWSPDDYIDNLYEVLRADHPDYISRTLLGKDGSGTYDIWRYIFEPPRPIKTIVISCGVHGFERISITGTFLFLREVANNWQRHPGLAFLRWNVRFVVIPVANPWGLAQSPSSRYTHTGTDINRNYDWAWEDWNVATDGQPKGASAFSEVETQYIRDTIAEFSDAIAHLDMHDINGPGNGKYTHIAYGPTQPLGGEFYNIVNKVFNSVKKDGEALMNFGGLSYTPSSLNWAAARYGMITGNLEAITDGSSTSRWTSLAMTRAVQFWGNVIIEISKRGKIYENDSQPWMRRIVWNRAALDPAVYVDVGPSYIELLPLRTRHRVSGAGYVRYSGIIRGTIVAGGLGKRVTVSAVPAIGQAQNILAAASTARQDLWRATTSGYHLDRVSIPFECVLPVHGDYELAVADSEGQLLRTGMWIRVEDTYLEAPSAKFEVSGFNGTVEFVPSGNSQYFKILRADGRWAEGDGAMVVTSPIQYVAGDGSD